MSISYDTMSAYMERETNRLVEEDKAVQKQIADNAITKVMATNNQINTNLDNAVETAYRQGKALPLKSETSQIGNQALTERLARGLNQNRAQINTTLDNLKAGIRANEETNNVETDREHLLPQAKRELEIRQAQAEQDKALQEALALAQAEEASKVLPPTSNETTVSNPTTSGNGKSAYTNLKNGLGSYFLSPTALKEGAIEKIEQAYNSGAISEEEASKLLDDFDLV